MDGAITESIRALAPKWSLAGDNQLLDLLQSTHQRIISKCQDVNSKLEGMATALDGASISLQNVNNKFMALSNSQFIESRVYDDDADVTAPPETVKEPPTPAPPDELAVLRRSLAALEAAHETAEIIDDSDSDSSDTEISVVLRPKDMYSHRPLPYIIGSQPWKNKWHAGLVVEDDSDTDSSASRDKAREQEQYSDSESERGVPTPRRRADDPTISETSSSFHSEQPTIDNTPPQKPADIAAELARRLGGPVQPIQQDPRDYSPPVPTTKKVYKPEQPVSSTIFPDEPPPLDYSSEDDDIFAEINKNKPYNQINRVQNNLADDLFGLKNDEYEVEKGDIFSDFAEKNMETKPVGNQKSTLFEEQSEPELFAELRKKEAMDSNYQEDISSTKKPVGGISLFGSNKGTESIGAAILKRNRQKSTSGEESGSDDTTHNNTEETRDNTQISKTTEHNKDMVKNYERVRNVPKNTNEFRRNVVKNSDNDETDNKSVSKKEKDIFDDLFAKSEIKEQRSKAIQPKPVKDTGHVKNLFSDNIFDDIDDIFTTDVKIPSKDTKQKSIFDDDDLFSDIDKPKSVNQLSSKDNKIFDSDDDLFSDVKPNKIDENLNKNTESHKNHTSVHPTTQKEKQNPTIDNRSKIDDINKPTKSKNSEIKSQIEIKSIFDSDSDDEIFANIKKIEGKNNTNASIEKGSDNENSSLKNSESVLKSYVKESKSAEKKQKIDEDLIKELDIKTKSATESLKVKEKSNVIQSPSIFDDDEIEELFVNTSKFDKVSAPKENNTEIKQNIITTNDIMTNKITDITSVLDITTITTKNITDCSIEKRKEMTRSSESKSLPQKDNNFHEKGPEINSKTIEIDSNPVTKQTTKITAQSEGFVKKKSDIFDNRLLEDNLFSTPKDKYTTKLEEKQFLEIDILAAEVVIGSSPEISESKLAEKQTKSNFISESSTDPAKISQHLGPTDLDTKTELPIGKEDLTPQDTNLNRSILDDFSEPVKEKQTVIPESQIQISNDIFDDIFSEPPAFEKPVEPKKSKNVNALFDDDSDDDALFFKKSDVISDEKPEIFSSNANFDLFVNEPPAIDVDFVIKSGKNDAFDDNVLKSASKNSSFDNHLSTSGKSNLLNDSADDLSRVPIYKDKSPTIDVASQPEVKSEKSAENKGSTKSQNSIFSQDKDNDKLNTLEPEKHSKTDEIPQRRDEIQNMLGKEIDSDDKLFSSLPNPNIPKSSQKEEYEPTKSYLFENDKNSKEDSSPSKKIGKLNTKNVNINVNALVPGASPKKTPKETKDNHYAPLESDAKQKMVKPNTSSGENNSKNVKSDKNESNAVKHLSSNDEIDHESTDKLKEPKSTASEHKPDSGILDNNISKQRPRIQVKRRPSSRKARLEAVRKSAVIDFDDTDNSSSFDEPAPSKSQVKNTKSKSDPTIENQKQMATDTTSYREEKNEIKDYKNDYNEAQNTNKEVDSNFKEQKTTTKVVYILNDEDIFNTKTKDPKSSDNNIFKDTDVTKTLDATEDTIKKTGFKTHQKISTEISNIKESRIANDDLFKTESNRQNDDDIFQNKGINALGKSYKQKSGNVSSKDTLKDVKSSLFDDSDDELFNKSKTKNVVKQSLFESDSEDDLFGGKKRKEQKNQEVKERKDMMKTSLFGDDDNDDDDLFGIKPKERADQKQSIPSTSRETSNKSTEPVFDDPLSLLGDD